jgi:hypothetical protein
MLDFQRFAVLEFFWSGFGVSLEFCALLQKTCDNRTNPRIKPLIFNALQTSLKCLSFNAFTVLGGFV